MYKGIIITGYGGQGIMQSGNILCRAAISEGYKTTFFPSYGAEMRGGSANCKVIISSKFIGSPVVEHPDYVLCFSPLALKKFYSKLKSEGLLFLNSGQVDSCNFDRVVNFNASEIAIKAGVQIAANMAMLGFFIGKTEILSSTSITRAIEEVFESKGENIVKSNTAVFSKGLRNALI